MASYGNPGSYATYQDYMNAYASGGALGARGFSPGAAGATPLTQGAWQAERNRYYSPVPANGGGINTGAINLGGGVSTPGATGGATAGGATVGGTSLAGMADPWMNERQGYMQQLSGLLSNPAGAMKDNPAFQYMQDQAIQAVNRGASKSGMLGSGNRLTELAKVGAGQASTNFFNMADLLGRLSGGFSQNPGAAANAELNAAQLGLEQQKLNRLLSGDADMKRDAERAAYDQHMQNFWAGMPRIGGAELNPPTLQSELDRLGSRYNVSFRY